MTSKLEEVERAVAEKMHLGWLYDERSCAILLPEKLGASRRTVAAVARAALEALMEPSEGMLEWGRRGPQGEYSYDHDALITWKDMVQAALEGK